VGAFFIHHNDIYINKAGLEQHFEIANFKDPLIIKLNNYTLYLYKKQYIKSKNYIHNNNFYLFVCGSVFYKGSGYFQSLEKLLSDYINSKIYWNELFGNYILIFYNIENKHIELFIDSAFSKFIYSDFENKIISSNFLAIKAASAQKYSLNKKAIIENLTTGHLISPDTYLNEIIKIDKVNIKNIKDQFDGITAGYKLPILDTEFSKRDDAINHANETLSKYFNRIISLTEEFGAHIGLTGGFDSRLLLMHAKQNIHNLITNSFWRPDSIEYKHAKSLATAANLNFFSFENSPFKLPPMEEQIEQAYLFFDGQIRSQNYWSEEFNNPNYSRKIAEKHWVGFHGCGGEQYRNADRLIGSISLNNFIKYEWMFKQGENVFLDKNWEELIHNNIERKIKRLVNIPKDRIGLAELKRIQNEILNNANRTTRLNAINQQQFYFAPFIEYSISHAAYNYIPFLGYSADFQIEMMRRIDHVLSEVPSNHGYNIIQGEPLKSRIKTLAYNLLPRNISNKIYLKIKKVNTTQVYSNYFDKSDNALTNSFRGIIDFDIIARNKNLGKNIDSFIYLLNSFSI